MYSNVNKCKNVYESQEFVVFMQIHMCISDNLTFLLSIFCFAKLQKKNHVMLLFVKGD